MILSTSRPSLRLLAPHLMRVYPNVPPRPLGLNAGVFHAGCMFISGGLYPPRLLFRLFTSILDVLFSILLVRLDVIQHFS